MIKTRPSSHREAGGLASHLSAEAIPYADEIVEAWKWEDPWLVPYLERLPRILYYAMKGLPPSRIAGCLPGLHPVDARAIERVLHLVAGEVRRRAERDRQLQRRRAVTPGSQRLGERVDG
ncbi:MAG: hypothetical protein HY331_06715 [Chloroflexi bacterium]|nr:hypothetical protein [Chloroflexota bacterium]